MGFKNKRYKGINLRFCAAVTMIFLCKWEISAKITGFGILSLLFFDRYTILFVDTMKAKLIIFLFAALALFASCQAQEAVFQPEAVTAASYAWHTMAFLETGENPIWFELSEAGPVQIGSPASASLTPFTPWPHSRHITGIMLWEGFLVMAVNTDGFLVLGPAIPSGITAASVAASAATNAVGTFGQQTPRLTQTALRRVAAPEYEYWTPYTIGSFFLWRDQPAVLLYRNDFFTSLYPESPRLPVFALDKSISVPIGVEVPALKYFPPGINWEPETLWRGHSGYWYFRMREKGAFLNRTAYFRSRDLERGEGGRISQGHWRDSDLPESPCAMPPMLATALDLDLNGVSAAYLLETSGAASFVLRAISTGFEGVRSFRLTASAEQTTRLYGFCREDKAVVITNDGRGLYSHDSNSRQFSLPALPSGFVYTGIAALGDIILATWEEQQGAGIAAAGFMVKSAFW